MAIFIAILALCVFAPSLVKNSAKGIFSEFSAPIDIIPSQLGDLETYWIKHSNSKRALIEAGRDLARLNASYTNKILENEFLKQRIERYETLLNMPSQERFNGIVARVIRRDISAWWQQIIIRRGSVDGVQVGDAVIYKGGVVGRVVQTTLTTSIVELVSSTSFRMAAYFESSSTPVIYQGAGSSSFSSFSGKVMDVPSSIQVSRNKPLALYTSSLAETFPEGIYIGMVTELVLDDDGLFKSGKVILEKSLYDLREVIVLTKVKAK